MFRGGSRTNTWDTLGSKSRPRARSDVLNRTCGDSDSDSDSDLDFPGLVAGSPFSSSWPLAYGGCESRELLLFRMGLRNPARCLLDPYTRRPLRPCPSSLLWPVTTILGTRFSDRYAPISDARARVLAKITIRVRRRPASASSRQTVFSFVRTSAFRLPELYGENSRARRVGRRCSRGETRRVNVGW